MCLIFRLQELYSLLFILLDANIDISRYILILGIFTLTLIFMDWREYKNCKQAEADG
jgi:hypothetical protein